MLLPEIKEREYRFKLALRMGLPIFALTIAFISNTFITTYENLHPLFYIESIILLICKPSIFTLDSLIYIASLLEGDIRTQKEVAQAAQVTEVTIRNRYKELVERLLFEVTL